MRATELDKLYFNSSLTLLNECLNTFQTSVDFALAKKDAEDKVIDEIMGSKTAINATLYSEYSGNLRKAVDRVFSEDNDSGLSDQLRANVSRFAAYKAYHATDQVREQVKQDGILDEGKKVLHTFNRYQAAEYNTTVSRCRTAKQFEEFLESDHARLFPNLRWLPSRSASLREEHMAFYDRVWAKDDAFWNTNQPGNLWNCKCDWEETSDPCTDGNPAKPIRHNGLEGNPAKTGEVFTDNCSYVKGAGKSVEKLCQVANQKKTILEAKKQLLDETTTCIIKGKKNKVVFNSQGIEHYVNDMFGQKQFWIKNEVLPNISSYIKSAKCEGRMVSDAGHNKNKKTKRLKEQTDYFYYFRTTLPSGEDVFLHIGRYNDKKIGLKGKMYLYSVSKNMPKNAEMP